MQGAATNLTSLEVPLPDQSNARFDSKALRSL